jgi:hypothetical protein
VRSFGGDECNPFNGLRDCQVLQGLPVLPNAMRNLIRRIAHEDVIAVCHVNGRQVVVHGLELNDVVGVDPHWRSVFVGELEWMHEWFLLLQQAYSAGKHKLFDGQDDGAVHQGAALVAGHSKNPRSCMN